MPPVSSPIIPDSAPTQAGAAWGVRPVACIILIALAHNLKLATVAEGVETEDDLEQLRTLGCDNGQGNFFAHPMKPKKATEYLANKQKK